MFDGDLGFPTPPMPCNASGKDGGHAGRQTLAQSVEESSRAREVPIPLRHVPQRRDCVPVCSIGVTDCDAVDTEPPGAVGGGGSC